MSTKLIVIYDEPDDVDGFSKHYSEVHTPLVKKLPGLQGMVFNRITSGALGNPAPFFAIAEMEFRDAAALQAAMQSPASAKVVEDVMAFTKGKVKAFVAQSEEK